jgi:hypothetical protein
MTLRQLIDPLKATNNFINEENTCRLNSESAHYHSVQNILSSYLLTKNLKINIYTYKTIIVPVIFYVCETWFENSTLMGTFGLHRDEIREGWRKLCNREFHTLYSLPNIIIITNHRG